MVAFFQLCSHTGTYGIEVHVNHAAKKRSLVFQAFALKSTLPEPSRATVLAVRCASNRLIQITHEPTERTQALSNDC